jgi:hypothetical protein
MPRAHKSGLAYSSSITSPASLCFCCSSASSLRSRCRSASFFSAFRSSRKCLTFSLLIKRSMGHIRAELSSVPNITTVLRWIKAAVWAPGFSDVMWQPIDPISAVPTDRDLQLAVLKGEEVHALVFPCRRRGQTWVESKSGRPVEVHPSHWREWQSK